MRKYIENFGFQVNDLSIIKRAMTHGSYTFEGVIRNGEGGNNSDSLENFERLEFLGDAVLKLCVSKYLYDKFENYDEGQLTKIRSILVSDMKLAQFAQKIDLNQYLILGKQEEKMGGRNRASTLACAFEALLGALYLQCQFENIEKFLNIFFSQIIDEIDLNISKYNAKAVLQEYTQRLNKDLPQYKVLNEFGKQHEKNFEIEVSYKNEILAIGSAKSKKEAEQKSAYLACVKLGILEENE